MSNEFDSIVPNTQVPKPSMLGTSGNKWSEVHSTSGSFDCIVVSGALVTTYDNAMAQAAFGIGEEITSATLIHDLGTEFIDIQVYDNVGQTVQPNTITVLDSRSIALTFVEPQACTILIQKGKL